MFLEPVIYILSFYTVLYDISAIFIALFWNASATLVWIRNIWLTSGFLVLYFWGYCLVQSYKKADNHILKLLFFTCFYAPFYYWKYVRDETYSR